jgi:hypothetical protein
MGGNVGFQNEESYEIAVTPDEWSVVCGWPSAGAWTINGK